MNRRSFIAGLLGTTAAVAIPHPNVPTGGEVNEAVASITKGEAQSLLDHYIGIALQSGKTGDVIDVMINGQSDVMQARLDLQVFTGDVITDL